MLLKGIYKLIKVSITTYLLYLHYSLNLTLTLKYT